MVWSERGLDALRGPRPDAVITRVPIELTGDAGGPRDLAAVTYAGDPIKRRLSSVLEAWSHARGEGEQLVVAGLPSHGTERWPSLAAQLSADGVEVSEPLTPDGFRALLRRARVFVAAPRIEDYGVAALEALASGCVLVTTPSAGPYPARDLARELDPRLVDDDLAAAIRLGLDDPPSDYARRAARLLEPFSRDAVDRVVAESVLPRLLSR
jgi:glycosyltransferase involved in cell wall biosynthesis